jgi:hypothetical protein
LSTQVLIACFRVAPIIQNDSPDPALSLEEILDSSNDLFTSLALRKTKKLPFVETVEDNKELYSRRQVKMAEVFRAGLHNAGFPSERDFRLMVQNGHISNCPIQVDDIDRHIHGKDVGLLKGKTQETNRYR